MTSTKSNKAIDAAGVEGADVFNNTEHARLNAWRVHIENPNSGVSLREIPKTISLVFDALDAGGPESLDFSGFNPYACSPSHLMAALRSVYLVRDRVPGWQEAVMVAYQAFEAIGEDADEILIGLLE